MDLLQGPPHRLDVLRVHRPVGLAHVDPAAHAVGHLLPQVDVRCTDSRQRALNSAIAERLDVGLAGEAELLLDRELDREAVAVPAALAVDLVALHGPEPREDVLERARLDVVGAGAAVGGRRTLVEGPRVARRRCAPRSSRRSGARARTRGRSCSRAGRSTCGGTGRYWLIGFLRSGGRARRTLTKGRRPGRLGPVPAVPPSLAGPIGGRPTSLLTRPGPPRRSTRGAGHRFFRRLRADLRP